MEAKVIGFRDKLIELFGAPNGLCLSITESKHIKAVKEPWWQSSHFEAVGQMLVTNQCLDKFSVFHAYHLHGALLCRSVPPAGTTISRLGARMVEEGEAQAVDRVHSAYVMQFT
ncbi:hypothetical protein ID866_9602 [Astraeus odoratus]|nr:hypothetical protein ID866_9602 [Astraeus odoratus]